MILIHLLVGAFIVGALLFSCTVVLLLAHRRLPHAEMTVKRSELISIDERNAKAVFLEVELQGEAKRLHRFRFRFLGVNREKICKTKSFQLLSEAFSPGSIVKMHYVPFFKCIGYFPETPVIRMETWMAMLGAVVAISLSVVSVSLAYG